MEPVPDILLHLEVGAGRLGSGHGAITPIGRVAVSLSGKPVLSTLQPEQQLVAGLDCYFKDLGSGRNRWGDYSHTVVDPTDDTKLWTIQEFAALSDSSNLIGPLQDKWSTWWGMMDPSP